MQYSIDPFAAARRVFFLLGMGVNDQDWEDWSGMHTSDVEGGFDRFVAFKDICSEAVQTLPDLTRDELLEFGFAQGCFEALAKVFDTLWLTQPVSSHTPKHMRRHRRQLVVGALQLNEEAA